jgi:hypothetical protein
VEWSVEETNVDVDDSVNDEQVGSRDVRVAGVE